MKNWFITGTDTGIGKTFVTRALLQATNNVGYSVVGYKPVATGCKLINNEIINNDALILQRYSNITLNLSQVNPIAFIEHTSPHIASVKQQQIITLDMLSAGLRKLEVLSSDLILIEGAGGWYTPLSERNTYADWVYDEQLSVILVVGIKLGCINHAILTFDAIKYRKLKILGWIANTIVPPDKFYHNYIDSLKKILKTPCLGIIPYIQKIDHLNNYGKYLVIP
ncbi:MAG: ATP-dependent dethiobiotin synthetase BioD [Pantoea sp. Brub]|nr:ATP-dependent dethiobiotin synthetase BioD [Pantoea sp. Brub]